MVDILECPVCKSQAIKPFRSCKDFTVSHETFTVNTCEQCTLGITSPRPETEKLGGYYQSDEYISHSGKSSGGIGILYKTARSFALSWKKRLIKKYSKKGVALDFGCGTGDFLQALKTSGWKIEGIEPAENPRKKAEEITGQKIHSQVSQLPEQTFDVITAWHVIEHVPNLGETIDHLKDLLKKDGTIFIAVPNYESPDAQRYKDFWAGYDVPRHLWHFSKKSMTHMLASYQLKVIHITPMKLDAYYVSMLSEKYRGGKSPVGNLLKGLLSGLRSNISAGRNNYSSLIYIVKRA